MWELDYKESWGPKNWCFWIVVLEKTLESSFDCREIQPVLPKGDQSWVFIGRTDAEAETPILLPPDANWLIRKDPDAGRDWRQEEKGMIKNEMVGWYHQFDGHTFEQASGVGGGQGGLACCSLWGCKESDTTEQLSEQQCKMFPFLLILLHSWYFLSFWLQPFCLMKGTSCCRFDLPFSELVIWSKFSGTYWPSVYLFWKKMSFQISGSF